MAEQTRSFDARDVIVTWGPIQLQGAAPGSFVKVTYDEDAVTKTVGAQGAVVALVQANDGGSLTWTASQASPTNDLLSAQAALQRLPGVGVVKFPLFLRHINGTTIAVAPEAWIKKVADVEFSNEHTSREWMFDIAHLQLFAGGSTR